MTRDLTDFIPRPGEQPMLRGIECFPGVVTRRHSIFEEKENDGF